MLGMFTPESDLLETAERFRGDVENLHLTICTVLTYHKRYIGRRKSPPEKSYIGSGQKKG